MAKNKNGAYQGFKCVCLIVSILFWLVVLLKFGRIIPAIIVVIYIIVLEYLLMFGAEGALYDENNYEGVIKKIEECSPESFVICNTISGVFILICALLNLGGPFWPIIWFILGREDIRRFIGEKISIFIERSGVTYTDIQMSLISVIYIITAFAVCIWFFKLKDKANEKQMDVYLTTSIAIYTVVISAVSIDNFMLLVLVGVLAVYFFIQIRLKIFYLKLSVASGKSHQDKNVQSEELSAASISQQSETEYSEDCSD